MSRKIVIVGGVAGGATAAARLSRVEKDAQIILFEKKDYISVASCGLPYYIGRVFDEREKLFALTPEEMREKHGVDVRDQCEVTGIDRDKKLVTVTKTDGSEIYSETYDVLLLATGSLPVRPPIPGIDSPRVRNLWTVPDADFFRAEVERGSLKQVVVVGGGFIGLEAAENLRNNGIDVTVVEMTDQVMAPLDPEMAEIVQNHLEEKGVHLILSDGVDAFEDAAASVKVKLKSGKELFADYVILSIGVRPNSGLAKQAGLEVGKRGGIVVDDYLCTADPAIYAVGDVIEVVDFVTKDKTMVPLAGPANRQARIVANNIAGMKDPKLKEKYTGTQGSAIVKVFELSVATTGINEKTLLQRGLEKGGDFETVTVSRMSRAGYYPGARELTIKLLFSINDGKLYGAQIVGGDGVDKRIDVIATALRLGATVDDLSRLELAYAPPYSTPKDPVNMVGYVARNLLSAMADGG